MKEEFKVIIKQSSKTDQMARRRYIANALSGLQPLILQERHKQLVEDIRKRADEQPEVIAMLIRYWLEKDRA